MSSIANVAYRISSLLTAARNVVSLDRSERRDEIAALLDELEAAIDETHELLQSGGYVAFTPLTELLAKWRKRIT